MMEPVGRRRRIAYAAGFVLFPLMLVSGCTTVAYHPPSPAGATTPPLTIPAAVQKVRDGLNNAGSASVGNCRYVYDDFDVSFTRFSFTAARKCANPQWAEAPESFTFQYRELQNLTIMHWSGSMPGYYTNIPPKIHWTESGYGSARGFVDGVNAMRYFASGADLADDAPKFARFQEDARAWRALPVKPALPEEVRRSQLLAEDAIKSKNFEGAINYYEQGIKVLPMWPEGQFNAALLYGELGIYGRAVSHMKRYLELRPDAQDAQAVRDQLVIWQAKISAPPPSLSQPNIPVPSNKK